jgi:hypothetical protein
MGKETIQITVEQSTYNLGQSLRQFVSDVRTAIANGVNVAAIPALLEAAVGDLLPAIEDASQVGAEYTDDPRAFVQGLSLSVEDIAFDLLSPPLTKGKK